MRSLELQLQTLLQCPAQVWGHVPSPAEIMQGAQPGGVGEEEVGEVCKRAYEFAERIIECLMFPGCSLLRLPSG